MKKDTLTISKSLAVKALLLSFVLLTIAFGFGLVIGKTDDSLKNLTSADEGEVREQLSDCSFKLQEITARHLSLTSVAKSKGLMDENGIIQKNIMCTVLDSEIKVDLSKTEKPEKETKEKDKNQVENKDESEKKEPEKKPEEKQVEKKKHVNMNCSFSIQLFSDPDKEKAKKARKSYPFNSKKLRLVEAEIRGRNWYRIRYGCYSSRAEAELDLPEVKDVVDSAIVVAD